MELVKHGSGGLVKRGARAQRVVLVWGALEKVPQQPHVKDIFRVGQILRHLLLDRTAFLVPEVGAFQNASHADRLDVQRKAEVLDRYGEEVLGDRLLGVGIILAAECGRQRGQLPSR